MKKQRKTIADGLINGLLEAARHSKGKIKLKERLREIPGPSPKWSPAKIRFLRKEVYKLSQPLFAGLMNVKPATVRAWEQGQKSPSGAAARLLQILEIDRAIIEKLVA